MILPAYCHGSLIYLIMKNLFKSVLSLLLILGFFVITYTHSNASCQISGTGVLGYCNLVAEENEGGEVIIDIVCQEMQTEMSITSRCILPE